MMDEDYRKVSRKHLIMIPHGCTDIVDKDATFKWALDLWVGWQVPL